MAEIKQIPTSNAPNIGMTHKAGFVRLDCIALLSVRFLSDADIGWSQPARAVLPTKSELAYLDMDWSLRFDRHFKTNFPNTFARLKRTTMRERVDVNFCN